MVILYSFHDNLHLLYEIYDNLHLTSLLHMQTLDTHVLKMMENFLEKSYWAICLSEFVHLKGSSQKNKTKKTENFDCTLLSNFVQGLKYQSNFTYCQQKTIITYRMSIFL